MKNLGMKNVIFIAFCAACACSLGFAGYVLGMQPDECTGIWKWIKSGNLRFYFSLLLLFAMVVVIIRLAVIPLKLRDGFEEKELNCSVKKQFFIVGFAAVMAGGIFFHWLTVELVDEFAFSSVIHPFFLLPKGLRLGMFAGGIFWVFSMIKRKSDISSVGLYLVYTLCLILCFYATYFVNVFKVDMHHGIAVLESIYNVCDLTPFDRVTTGIYGHYSLFFLIPMRLSHGSLYMAAGMLALFCCITAGAVFYVAHAYLPTNWLKAVLACATVIEVTVLYAKNYWQVHPIREMFPLLLCAYVCFLSKRKRDAWSLKRIMAGYILGTAAVLWNTESGLFCLIAFSAYIIVAQLQRHAWYDRHMVCVYMLNIFFCIGSVLLSIGIVNVYNLFCGGVMIFEEFFFPLFSKSYMGILRYDMEWGNHAWVYVYILFMAVLMWGIYHTRLFKSGENAREEAPMAVVVALLGLLLFSYYVNRAAYLNLTICYLEALCANILLIKETWPSLNVWREKVSFWELGRKGVAIVCISVMVCLGTLLPLSFARLTEDYHHPDIRTTGYIVEDLAALTERMPENVYGVGTGISVLYHILGWDNYAHTRDFSDLKVGGEEAFDKVVADILQQDSFLISDYAYCEELLEKVLSKKLYIQMDTFTVQGIEFYYYQSIAENIQYPSDVW